MNPKKFPQAQFELQRPTSMTEEECESLWVARIKGDRLVSLWTASLWERIKFVFHGKMWLTLHSGDHPPVRLDIERSVFEQEEE